MANRKPNYPKKQIDQLLSQAELDFAAADDHQIAIVEHSRSRTEHMLEFGQTLLGLRALIESVVGKRKWKPWCGNNIKFCSRSTAYEWMKRAQYRDRIEAICPDHGQINAREMDDLIADFEEEDAQAPKRTIPVLNEPGTSNACNPPVGEEFDFMSATSCWSFLNDKNKLEEVKKIRRYENRMMKFTGSDGKRGDRAKVQKLLKGRARSGRYSNFSPYFTYQIYQRFGSYLKSGDKILDPFCGGATRGLVAADLGFNYHGIDIREEAILANQVIANKNKLGLVGQMNYHVGDAREITISETNFDFSITSPPYWTLETYSDKLEDLSNAKTLEDFQQMLLCAAKATFVKMKPGTMTCVVIGNLRPNEKFIDLRTLTANVYTESEYEFWDEVIIRQPDGSAGKTTGNDWKKLHSTRRHEYLLVFKKPGPFPAKKWSTKSTHGDMEIKVSEKWLRTKFIQCGPDCIKQGCEGNCCDPVKGGTLKVSIHSTEEKRIKALGGNLIGGFLQPKPGETLCPFKSKGHLCNLHGTGDKPFGCIASPLMLNKHDTLILRHRYVNLPGKDDAGEPAYKAYRASLDEVLGKREAARLCKHLDGGGGDTTVKMTRAVYDKLKDRENNLSV